MKLKSYDEIDLLVDKDPLELRDYAWAVTRKLAELAPKRSESQIYNDVMERY